MQKKARLRLFERIDPVEKLIISLVAGILAFLLAGQYSRALFSRLMLGWDIFCLAMIVSNWVTFHITSSNEIRIQSQKQDPKGATVFTLVLLCAVISIFVIVSMIVQKADGNAHSAFRLPIAIAGMVLSWLLIHTLFVLRYAHIYYGNDVDNPTNHAGGLLFPGEKRPEYSDFFYFSFVLGMTFQVSDVQITSSSIRKIATWHGMISFAYNTIIIALVINLMV